MQIRIENNGIKDVTVIKAEEGKTFRRKGTDEVLGYEIWLGYSWYINGVKLDEPHLDTPEDFEEIDNPDEIEIDDPEEEEVGEDVAD